MRSFNAGSGAKFRIYTGATMNFESLRKQATIRRARKVTRPTTPIKTPDYFYGDFSVDDEFESVMAEQQKASEPAEPVVPSQPPTTGGKTVDDYYKALERQAEKFRTDEEASEDEGDKDTVQSPEIRTRSSNSTYVPLSKLFDDDELDADIPSSDETVKVTSSDTAETDDTTPIKTPPYLFNDDELDADIPSSSPLPESSTAATMKPMGRLMDDDELDADMPSSDQTAMTTSSDTAETGDTSPIATPPYFFEDDDNILSSKQPTTPKKPSSSTLTTTPLAPKKDSKGHQIVHDDCVEDFDWYQYPTTSPSDPNSGRWTPQFTHARRAPRIKGCVVTVWAERSKTFFSFPPEVRNRIYKYALFPKGVEYAPRPFFSEKSTWKVKAPALLRASFDVRREALSLYYNEIQVGCTAPVFAKMWLSKIGKEARGALGGVTVPFDYQDQKNQTDEQQREKFFEEFRAAGVEVRREVIEVR